MKTITKLRLLVGSFFMLILFVGCKNEAKTEGTTSSTTPTTEENDDAVQ